MSLTMNDLIHIHKVTWIFEEDRIIAVPHSEDPPVVFTRNDPPRQIGSPTGWWLTDGELISEPGEEFLWLADMGPGIVNIYHDCDSEDPDECNAGDNIHPVVSFPTA